MSARRGRGELDHHASPRYAAATIRPDATVLAAARSAAFETVGRRMFYGWAILAVAAAGVFASGPAQSYTFGIFIGPLGADLGLSRTWIASAYGFATLIAAFALPQMGRLVDRHGPRRTLLAVAVLYGVACLGFAGVAGGLTLTLGFACLRFLGQGSLMLICANLVSQWFRRQRGFASSLMALGFSSSMAVHPPLAQWLTELTGWRGAWVGLGVLTWALLLVPVALLVYDTPEQVGLAPDGDTGVSAGTGEGGAGESRTTGAGLDVEIGLTLGAALRTSAFCIVAAGLAAIALLLTALHLFQVSIFGAHGLGPHVAARVFPVSAITMILAMPLVGRALDRVRTEWAFAAGLAVLGAALVGATLVRDLPTAIAYAVVFGVANAAGVTFSAYLWPRYFGRRHLGSIQGTGQMIGVVGAALGPLPLGFASDAVGGYTPTLLALAGLALVCAVAALFLREPSGSHPSTVT